METAIYTYPTSHNVSDSSRLLVNHLFQPDILRKIVFDLYNLIIRAIYITSEIH
jgi:hypothetical protein